MADSGVRQKFEVPSETPDAFEEAWKKYNSRGNAGGWEKVAFTSGFGKGFEAGMRAGEIARWIPVTEEENLPKIIKRFGPKNCYGESAEVLVYSGHICTAVIYTDGTWATDEGSQLTGVTHWQPLPAAPEEKKP